MAPNGDFSSRKYYLIFINFFGFPLLQKKERFYFQVICENRC